MPRSGAASMAGPKVLRMTSRGDSGQDTVEVSTNTDFHGMLDRVA